MSWIGTWENQYGSTVEIAAEADGRVEGVFVTALKDSGFSGMRTPIVGIVRGNCINFAATCCREGNDMIVSYTGLLREGRLETMWFYAADTIEVGGEHQQVPWWKAIITNADTFDRI